MISTYYYKRHQLLLRIQYSKLSSQHNASAFSGVTLGIMVQRVEPWKDTSVGVRFCTKAAKSPFVQQQCVFFYIYSSATIARKGRFFFNFYSQSKMAHPHVQASVILSKDNLPTGISCWSGTTSKTLLAVRHLWYCHRVMPTPAASLAPCKL